MDKKRVLAIDYEKVVLDSVEKVLSAEHFVVDVTLKGKKGIELALENSYDVVLTDIRMPDIGGLIVLRDIKRRKPALPVIIITGYGSVRSAVQAMKLGATNYIEKPFSSEELCRAVSAAIENGLKPAAEDATLIHPIEIAKVLEKGALDPEFARKVFMEGAEALARYQLTQAEKLAIITGDAAWIEDQIGAIDVRRKQWLIDGKR